METLTPYPINPNVASAVAMKRARHTLDGGCPSMAEQCRMAAQDAVIWQAALILEGRRSIITRSQTKLDKSKSYLNRGLTLASAHEARPWISPKFTACAGATETCIMACVGSRTGQGALPSSAIARIGRTIALHVDPVTWWRLYDAEIRREERKASKLGVALAFRVNIATDLTHIAGESKRRHPAVEHYDYTAILPAMRRNDGVHRVFSRKDGKQSRLAVDVVNRGMGVAVVFAVSARSGGPLPATWQGAPVIDGDYDDTWFARKPASGPFVVGLRVKGSKAQMAQAVASGFAVAAA